VKINKNKIGAGSPCYLIAEISHNHQGKEDEAMKIIEAAAANGASAVKFQKRDNANLFLADFYNKPYKSKSSFGKTYGEHREYLEPRIAWLKKANQLAHRVKLDFIMTVFDEASLLLCEKELKIDAYKIQSADLTSHFLIEKVARTKKPYFISCGAASLSEIKATFKFCTKLKTPFCLMYAVSEYPTADEHVNLCRIVQLKKIVKTELIGFSCHHQSIEPAIYSRLLGTVAIEKHFTLNKLQKGPDHKLSLMPKELRALKERLMQADIFSGKTWTADSGIEIYQSDARYKMGKCAVAAKDLQKGSILHSSDIRYQSPMQGANPLQIKKHIGKALAKNVKKGQLIQLNNF
jgi:sialic acid synthase SpsE